MVLKFGDESRHVRTAELRLYELAFAHSGSVERGHQLLNVDRKSFVLERLAITEVHARKNHVNVPLIALHDLLRV